MCRAGAAGAAGAGPVGLCGGRGPGRPDGETGGRRQRQRGSTRITGDTEGALVILTRGQESTKPQLCLLILPVGLEHPASCRFCLWQYAWGVTQHKRGHVCPAHKGSVAKQDTFEK